MREMIDDDEIAKAVRKEQPHVLLLSGGGNDLVHKENLATMLDPGEDQLPEDAPNARFDTFIAGIVELYRGLFERMAREFPKLQIVVHGYDYAIPNNGKWIGRPMASIRINDRALQEKIFAVVINRYNTALGNLVKEFPDTVSYVDCRGSILPTLWHDELHPTNDGFRSVAERFVTVIDKAVPSPA